jgi:hypothetical protein
MDLPRVLDAAIDSFVRISVIVKGEPLKYRWYCNDELIEGADQPQLIISQSVQWHDQAKYRCQITNWKGTIETAEMELKVFGTYMNRMLLKHSPFILSLAPQMIDKSWTHPAIISQIPVHFRKEISYKMSKHAMVESSIARVQASTCFFLLNPFVY